MDCTLGKQTHQSWCYAWVISSLPSAGIGNLSVKWMVRGTCSRIDVAGTDQRKQEAVKVKLLSRVQLFTTPWSIAHQAPQSMEFSRQEYWSGLPFPSPGDLANPGIEPASPALQADVLPSKPPGEPQASNKSCLYPHWCWHCLRL